MLTCPEIEHLRWFPESRTKPDDVTYFDFEVINKSTEYNIVITEFFCNLTAADGSATKVPARACVNQMLVDQEYHPITPYGVTIYKGSSRKFRGRLKTTVVPTIDYPYPFRMEVGFDWEIDGTFNCEKSIAKTIEPD